MRTLAKDTLIVLKKPYPVGGGKTVREGRIHEALQNNRYGIRFQGHDNAHGPITVDFSRKEFVLARTGT
jgi:hypothetical protein